MPSSWPAPLPWAPRCAKGTVYEAVLWDGERAVGVRYASAEGVTGEIRARWVIDASGRSGLIARERTLRAVDPFYPDLSVYAYVEDARRFAGQHAGNLLIEAVPWGWFWFIPLHTGEVSVGLVCDRSSRERTRARGLDGFFRDALATSTLVGSMVAAGRLARGPIATTSHGYSSARYAGPGWLLAGDAGSFVDPMWATGVANALTDGLMAAGVVEAVGCGRVAEAAAVAHYDAQVAQRTDQTLALVRFVYGSNHLHGDEPFWRSATVAAGRHHAVAGRHPAPPLGRPVGALFPRRVPRHGARRRHAGPAGRDARALGPPRCGDRSASRRTSPPGRLASVPRSRCAARSASSAIA